MGKKKGKKSGGGGGVLDDDGDGDAVPPKTSPSPTTDEAGDDDDLSHIRDEMKAVLRKYIDQDKPDDWLARSVEKNLKLKKRSVNHATEAFSLMREEVEAELDVEEPMEEEEEVPEEEDGADSFDADEARRRAEAKVFGTSHLDDDDDGGCDEDRTGEDREIDTANDGLDESDREAIPAGPPNRLLLSLIPYAAPIPGSSTSASPLAFLYVILYRILCLFFSASAVRTVEAEYAHRNADELASYDDEMREVGNLWCPNSQKWIARDDTYSVRDSYKSAETEKTLNLPETIRWSDKSKKWERWSKNLKTKVSKKKQQQAEKDSGGSQNRVVLTKGTWIPSKVGEGWVSAPQKAEVEDKQIIDADVRFYVCLDKTTVVDCTEWACSALMTKETPRALGVVDGGRAVFKVSDLGDGKGVEGRVLSQYGGDEDDFGDIGGGGGKKKGGKEKKSRADKKAKKMAYER